MNQLLEPIRDLTVLHPRCVQKFAALANALSIGFSKGLTQSRFLAFETYRTPHRQQWIRTHQARNTKAGAWQSPHQYGLAVDFVPYDGHGVTALWSWDPKEDWAFLKAQAEELGLSCPIEWDRPHVEDPYWSKLKWDLKVPSAVNDPGRVG